MPLVRGIVVVPRDPYGHVLALAYRQSRNVLTEASVSSRATAVLPAWTSAGSTRSRKIIRIGSSTAAALGQIVTITSDRGIRARRELPIQGLPLEP